MKLWNRLYYTVWLAFFSCVLISRWLGDSVGAWVHILFGMLLLIMTLTNARSLKTLEVPQRLKRISKVAAGFAVFQVIGGGSLGMLAHSTTITPIVPAILRGAHVVFALAILAQSSSLATAYDMWEEKEFNSK
jgi:hypothetical protein